jgi:hypothetical protein
MARSVTTNLKLILEDTLTTSSKYNLERIDSLGEVFTITDDRNVEVRAERNITMRPNAAEAGGTGSGGVFNLGTTTQFLDNLYAYTDLFTVFGDLNVASELRLSSGSNWVGFQARSPTANQIWTLPDTDGTSGEVLGTDGAGNLDWVSPSGKDSGVFTWNQVDGDSKTITHNFNAANIQVIIYDLSDGQQVSIEEIDEINTNVVTLTALQAPPPTGYEVQIQEL